MRKVGQGGMGVVYAARDERLGRVVALKTMSALGADDAARKRFWREAQAAARINHPNVCQLYELGEDGGELFIAMELLEGEPLSARIERGPLAASETRSIGLEILAALEALHARDVVHRDLKPSNVFLTPHGVKLLDFGLARSVDPGLARSLDSGDALTRTGAVLGTPRYMAPEQVTGEALDGRTDLFALGAVLFEMLAGRPAFGGRNVVEILHATLNEQPPALTGSPGVVALDRLIRRALAKHPADRPPSAQAMAAELRGVPAAENEERPVLAQALTRLVVLPFRILRPDPETDFLAISLADAIATSLSSIESLILRSSATAARFGSQPADLRTIAAEADVDRVVMGTLLRSGGELRAAVQLVDAPAGTLLASHTVHSTLGDLFRLQDDITRRLVEALSPPLAGRVLPRDEPHTDRAYALYLQANELGRSYEGLPEAHDLYQRCVDLDPEFAPAWAQLGRCHRVIGKYLSYSENAGARAEHALRRALELNPRLSVAHKIYAQLESDMGEARRALVRLLGEARRHGNDPELFAGLVHACRYCGLFDESIAAHDEARRLDPHVPTSIEQTMLMTGEVERLLAVERLKSAGSGDQTIRVVGLGLAERREEARAALSDLRSASRVPAFRIWSDYLMAWLDQDVARMMACRSVLGPIEIMNDPEAIFQEGWLLCDAGAHEQGLDCLRRAVAKGYTVAPTLRRAPQFGGLRGDAAFDRIVATAEEGRQRALADFREHDGVRLLGLGFVESPAVAPSLAAHVSS